MPETVNPYASPAIPSEPTDPAVEAALRRLRAPSMAILVIEGLTAAAGVVFLPFFAFFSLLPFFDPNFQPLSRLEDLIAIPIFLLSYPVFYGAWQMRHGTKYRWSYSAAILACVPWPSPFTLVLIPAGIWALIVLHRRDVKEAFARNAENRVQKIGSHNSPVG